MAQFLVPKLTIKNGEQENFGKDSRAAGQTMQPNFTGEQYMVVFTTLNSEVVYSNADGTWKT